MTHKRFGVYGKAYLILILVMAILIPTAVCCNRYRLAKTPLPPTIVGEWTGQVEVFAPFKRGKSPSSYPEDWISVALVIDETGKVSGQIGDAHLTPCQVKLNRNDFERWINIETDFYIQEATLTGPISPLDPAASRIVSIPFNIIDGQLRGSIFQVEDWHYPDPLFPYLLLNQVVDRENRPYGP